MEAILIFKDSNKRNLFINSANAVRDEANDLIQTYNLSQDWERIETLEDFYELYDDPLALFDRTLLENIDIKAKGNKQPDPAVLSALFQIDRPGFMSAIGYKDDPDCPDCKKSAQTVKVKRIKTTAEFNQYAEFLLFINGFFQLNNQAIELHCATFDIWASSPEQISLYKHWESLVKILNQHDKKYPISTSGKDQTAKALKLQLSEGTGGKFVVNMISLSEQVKYMKS